MTKDKNLIKFKLIRNILLYLLFLPQFYHQQLWYPVLGRTDQYIAFYPMKIHTGIIMATPPW